MSSSKDSRRYRNKKKIMEPGEKPKWIEPDGEDEKGKPKWVIRDFEPEPDPNYDPLSDAPKITKYDRYTRTEQIEKRLKSRHKGVAVVDFKGFDIRYARVAAETYDEFAKEHPKAAKRTVYIGRDTGVYEGTAGKNTVAYVTVNDQQMHKDSVTGRMRKGRAFIMSSHFFGNEDNMKAGMSYMHKTNWTNQATVRGTVMHETAHLLHQHMLTSPKDYMVPGGNKKNNKTNVADVSAKFISDGYRERMFDAQKDYDAGRNFKENPNFVSHYARHNMYEMFAENYVAWKHGRAKDSPYVKGLAKLIGYGRRAKPLGRPKKMTDASKRRAKKITKEIMYWE